MLPLPPLPPLSRAALLLQLWPAPPPHGTLCYDPNQSLVVRMQEDLRTASEQLWREGVLMTYKVGLPRMMAVEDRAIANKKRRTPRPPPLPPKITLPRLPPPLPPRQSTA